MGEWTTRELRGWKLGDAGQGDFSLGFGLVTSESFWYPQSFVIRGRVGQWWG